MAGRITFGISFYVLGFFSLSLQDASAPMDGLAMPPTPGRLRWLVDHEPACGFGNPIDGSWPNVPEAIRRGIERFP